MTIPVGKTCLDQSIGFKRRFFGISMMEFTPNRLEYLMTDTNSRPEILRLYDACQTVSSEAFTVSDLRQFIGEKTPKLRAALKDAFRFMTTWDYSRPEVLNVSAVRSRLSRVRYTDIEELQVAKPVSFTGGMGNYAVMFKAVNLPFMMNMVEQVIRPTTAHLAALLNDTDALAERYQPLVIKDYDRKCLEKVLESEAAYHIAGNHSAEAAFGDLYNNNNECYTTMSVFNGINADRWKNANPKAITKAVDALTQTADALFATINNLPAERQPTKETMAGIADSLELAARWVEWYSAVSTRLSDTTSALKTTEKTLLRAL